MAHGLTNSTKEEGILGKLDWPKIRIDEQPSKGKSKTANTDDLEGSASHQYLRQDNQTPISKSSKIFQSKNYYIDVPEMEFTGLRKE